MGSRMPYELRKTNHAAIAGFLLPFAAAGVTGLLILASRGSVSSLKFSIPFLSAVPLLLAAGLVLSLKSIRLIQERDDRDYAYAGLTMNILFSTSYLLSLIYFFSTPSL